jgi:hypothetical protein
MIHYNICQLLKSSIKVHKNESNDVIRLKCNFNEYQWLKINNFYLWELIIYIKFDLIFKNKIQLLIKLK